MPVRTLAFMCQPLNTRLRVWRLEHGLTLEDLAGLTGFSIAMLSRVERGQRRLRPLDRVRFARRVGVPVRALFEVEDQSAEQAVGDE
jgi:transcriptional regulator with XRE-family HTH domain